MTCSNATIQRGTILGVLLMLVAGSGLAVSTPAHAQDALGDGHALDANLQVGSGGRNPAGRNLQREFAFRNAIVTGNVPGGMAFRGELGYSAADDFRGALGSTELFDFQRDSFYSTLATRNLGGIDPLRSSLSWSIAGQRDGVFGDLIIARPGAGATAAGANINTATTPRIDVFGAIDGSMRSPSSLLIDGELRPQVLGVARNEQTGETSYMSASSLLGIKPLSSLSPVFGRQSVDVLDARRALEMQPALPDATVPGARRDSEEELQVGEPAANQILPERVSREAAGAQNASMHDRVVSALRIESNFARAQRAGVTDPALPGTTAEPSRVTSADGGDTPDPNDPLTFTEPDPSEPTDGQESFDDSFDRLREMLRMPNLPTPVSSDPTGPVDEEPADEDVQSIIDGLVQNLIAGEIPEVDSLEPSPSSSATFRAHVRAGQEHLRDGEWFAAEERFTAALSIEPGDPGTAIGRVVSQLGAGMYLSGALNLRDLLRAYPELLAVRFDKALLPSDERTERIRAQLRQRVEDIRPLSRDAGLLLAFLGYQTRNAEDIAEGFAAIERVEAALDINPDPVHIAARAAWQRPAVDTPQDKPTETPAP